ncbi:MAG: cation-transporting P-type ATPase [Anaerolineales bacterium]|nr:cation-transporting P-type ATPase [Anaerolineales bacterium]
MNSSPIHGLRVSEVFQAFETSTNGLTHDEAEARLSLYGKNLLSDVKPIPKFPRFIKHTAHPMALLLWVAGFIAFLVFQPVLGIVIWSLVIVNAGFSFWQDYRTEKAIASLHDLLPKTARVIREGVEVKISASDLVPGDILVLSEGDNIPADARVVEEYGLRVNNANLTGEALPIRKIADASLRADISEIERPNLIFAGTSVISGTGKAVLFATGMLTQFGRIARLTQVIEEETSPLQHELLRITRIMAMVAIGIGAAVFAVGFFEIDMGLFESFLLALGIIVAIIPEGLPATTTLALAFAGQRLAQKGVLVKKLSVVETLGNVSIIATDKSGTLTQNQMTVREIWVGRQRISVSGVGYEPKGSFLNHSKSTLPTIDLQKLFEAGYLCNNARLNSPTPEHPQWTSLGDQTEAALKAVALKGGIAEKSLLREYPRIHELPFDARRKRMSTIHEHDHREIAFVKGAPREVLDLCDRVLINGETIPLDASIRQEVIDANDEYASHALRVLALAQRDVERYKDGYSAERVEKNLTFIGLAAMMDPPRPEVAKAVKVCREAGIRMVMITGDYGLTAESFARRVGMLSTPNPIIITGADLDHMSENHLKSVLSKEVIFARMAPEHKLRLVSALQEKGEVVAVTGDGVNDVPMLRKADVGIAMGIVGTDVAKDAADIIITNDNFAAIINAIEEGRSIFENIKKFITYIFSSNVPEILPFLLTSTFNIPLALTVIQILAIDLGTDIFPALALGTEKPEANIMKRPPRRRETQLIDGKLLSRAFLWLGPIEGLLCFFGFYMILDGNVILKIIPLPVIAHWVQYIQNMPLSTGERYTLAVSVFHAGVVFAQVGNAFACRTEENPLKELGVFSNPRLLLGIVIEILIIFGLIYIKPFSQVFDHFPIPGIFWWGLVLYAPLLFILESIRKILTTTLIKVVYHNGGHS